MPKLEGVKLLKVFKGKSGTSKYGDWQAYNLFIDDPDWQKEKFGYFQSGKKPVPTVGMTVDLEYKEEETNGYVNYKVGTMTVHGSGELGGKPKPKPKKNGNGKTSGGRDSGEDKELSFCLSYCKDVMVALIGHSDIPYQISDFQSITEHVTRAAHAMHNYSTRKPSETSGKKEEAQMKNFMDVMAVMEEKLGEKYFELAPENISEITDRETQKKIYYVMQKAVDELREGEE